MRRTLSIILIFAMLFSLLMGVALTAGAADEPLYEPIDEAVDDLLDETIDRATDETTDVPADKPDEEAGDSMSDDSEDDASDEPADDPADEEANESADEPSEEIVGELTDEPVDEPADELIDEVVDKEAENSEIEPDDEFIDEQADEAADRPLLIPRSAAIYGMKLVPVVVSLSDDFTLDLDSLPQSGGVWTVEGHRITYTGLGPLTIRGSNANHPRRVYVTNATEIFIEDNTEIIGTIQGIASGPVSIALATLEVPANTTITGGGKNIVIGRYFREDQLRARILYGINMRTAGNLKIDGDIGEIGGLTATTGQNNVNIAGNIGSISSIQVRGNLTISGNVDYVTGTRTETSVGTFGVMPIRVFDGHVNNGGITISGRIGNLHWWGTDPAMQADGGFIHITGKIENITLTNGNAIAIGWNQREIYISGDIGKIVAGRYGLFGSNIIIKNQIEISSRHSSPFSSQPTIEIMPYFSAEWSYDVSGTPIAGSSFNEYTRSADHRWVRIAVADPPGPEPDWGNILDLSDPPTITGGNWIVGECCVTYTGEEPLTIKGSNEDDPFGVIVTRATGVNIEDDTTLYNDCFTHAALTLSATATLHGSGSNISITSSRTTVISADVHASGGLTISGKFGSITGEDGISVVRDLAILGTIDSITANRFDGIRARNATISGTINNITAGRTGIWGAYTVTIDGAVGNVTGTRQAAYDIYCNGIFANFGINITETGSIGDISNFITGARTDMLKVEGTIGDISARDVGINANVDISGVVGNITLEGERATRSFSPEGVFGPNIAGIYGHTVDISGEVGNITLDGESPAPSGMILNGVGVAGISSVDISGTVGNITGIWTRDGQFNGGSFRGIRGGSGELPAAGHVNISGSVGNIECNRVSVSNGISAIGGDAVISGTVGFIDAEVGIAGTEITIDGPTEINGRSIVALVQGGSIYIESPVTINNIHTGGFGINRSTSPIVGRININSPATVIGGRAAMSMQPTVGIPNFRATWSLDVSGLPVRGFGYNEVQLIIFGPQTDRWVRIEIADPPDPGNGNGEDPGNGNGGDPGNGNGGDPGNGNGGDPGNGNGGDPGNGNGGDPGNGNGGDPGNGNGGDPDPDPDNGNDDGDIDEDEHMANNNIDVNVTVDRNTHGDFHTQQHLIRVRGAAFNAPPNGTANIHFSDPDSWVEIDGERYHTNRMVQVNIQLMVDGVPLAPGTPLAVPIEITVPIPTGLGGDPELFRILHFQSDGTYQIIIPTINEDGTCTFVVTHFSVFVFVDLVETAPDTTDTQETETQKPPQEQEQTPAPAQVLGETNIPRTGDNANSPLWISLLSISALGIALAIAWQKKRLHDKR